MSFDGSEEDKFDSINAQFMAYHDFIACQIGRGWAPVDRIYEDRGYSGGNTRRPGLQQLLSDIESNLIDVVLVYRLDRLSRHTPGRRPWSARCSTKCMPTGTCIR